MSARLVIWTHATRIRSATAKDSLRAVRERLLVRAMLGAFGSRDFRLLWAGQTVSLIGNAALLVAVGWRTSS